MLLLRVGLHPHHVVDRTIFTILAIPGRRSQRVTQSEYAVRAGRSHTRLQHSTFSLQIVDGGEAPLTGHDRAPTIQGYATRATTQWIAVLSEPVWNSTTPSHSHPPRAPSTPSDILFLFLFAAHSLFPFVCSEWAMMRRHEGTWRTGTERCDLETHRHCLAAAVVVAAFDFIWREGGCWPFWLAEWW